MQMTPAAPLPDAPPAAPANASGVQPSASGALMLGPDEVWLAPPELPVRQQRHNKSSAPEKWTRKIDLYTS
jgi:hypothetical protein